ncbi:MAG: CBS domain-containing protein [Candidatus Thorarchaeota archaeon]|nr:CBS domain-containing protein [Candidatus Thorarchaeota archaeon]
MKVSSCMQTDVACVAVPGTREDVLMLMAEKQVNGLPVVKKGTKKLVGIVTRSDLLRKADEEQLAMLMNRDPVTLTAQSDLKTAVKTMLEKGYRRIPVVDGEDLVGLITVPDVLIKVIEGSELFETKTISDFVTRRVTAVWDQTPLPLSYMIMDMAGQNSLVVLSSSGNVTGLVTVNDYIRLSEETVEDSISKTHTGTEAAVEWGWTSKDFLVVTKKLLRMPNVPVGRVVTKNIISVTEVTSVAECIRVLKRNQIDQAPVLSATGSLVGMIEDRAFLGLALDSL